MKQLAKKYDSNTIPDKIEIFKRLSEVNKLRHQFWSQLRAVRGQIIRYIRAHEIPKKDFNELTKTLPEAQREYFKMEWEAGKNIPIEELEQILHIVNLLWSTSQFEEELRRKRGNTSLLQDIFFKGPVCKNCGLPLTGRQRVFCSIACADQYRKREYASRRRKNKNIGLKSQKKTEGKTPKGPNPQPGEGEKNLDCLDYGKCLDIALDWESFNCEQCPLKNR